MAEDYDPQIRIPFDPLEDHLQCSICLTAMKKSVLTPCSHRYCYKCISEWIERERSCPCCKQNLTVEKLYYDTQFDSLVDQILLYRDKAEEEHIDKMFNQAANLSNNNTPESQFQEILRKHLKKSLVSIEKYFYRLQQEYRQKIRQCEWGIIPEDMKGTVKDPEELRQQLEKHLKDSQKLGAEALDKYLTNSIPPLEFLPVTVSMYINDKKIRLPNVVFQPADRLSDVKTRIEESLRKLSHQISSWTEEQSNILLISPLAKREHYDMDELLDTASCRDDISVLTWDTQPVLQNLMCPGCELVVTKAFRLVADEPLRCYVKIFKEQGPQPTDYFSCTECNSKWICKSCVLRCHVGHQITPFVLQHTPSWGCCYCAKKKLCKIQNDE